MIISIDTEKKYLLKFSINVSLHQYIKLQIKENVFILKKGIYERTATYVYY